MAAKTRKPKQTKTCFIVRRYFVKRNQNVCCVVRNGESKEYNVTVQPDGRVTCLNVETGERCKGNNSKHQCYHVKAVLEAETKREERKQATKPAAPVATYNVVEEATKVVAEYIEREESDMYSELGSTKKVSVRVASGGEDWDYCEGCQCRVRKGQRRCPNC